MRIVTWNIVGRMSAAQVDFALALECDVLLHPDVNDRFMLPGLHETRSADEMAAKRRWAAVVSAAPLTPPPDPHLASAASRVAARSCLGAAVARPRGAKATTRPGRIAYLIFWTARCHPSTLCGAATLTTHGSGMSTRAARPDAVGSRSSSRSGT